MPTLSATPIEVGTLVDPSVVLSRPPKVLDDETSNDQPSRPRPPRVARDTWFSGSPGGEDPNEECVIEYYTVFNTGTGEVGSGGTSRRAFSRNCPQLNG